MSLWSVAALGIGSMVGAGIFALLGQAALVAHQDTWISFALGGVVALLSGHSYGKLAARFPSNGGIMDYFYLGFPSRVLSGALSLLYLVTLAVTIAMVARTFGAYASALLTGGHNRLLVDMFASGIIVLLTILNLVGAGAVGRAEIVLVGIKLVILCLLMIAGAVTIRPDLMAGHGHVPPSSLLASVGLTFFAYAGYGMMANASDEVADPVQTIPRAIMLAILVAGGLYVGLAVVVLGNVSPTTLAAQADTAVAEAARPVLGRFGFTIVSIGALLATSSAINATLFSGLNIARGLAEKKQLPALFAEPVWGQGTKGLIWSVAGILLITNLLDLSAIANIASATFLISYLAVFVAHWRLRGQTGAGGFPIALGFVAMAVVFASFMVSVWQSQPVAMLLIVLFVGGSIAVQAVLQRGRSAP
ncbi:MAG: APC family permease [Alsobacter sp.]